MPKQKRARRPKSNRERARGSRGKARKASSGSRKGTLARRLFNFLCCCICGSFCIWLYLFSPLEISIHYQGQEWNIGYHSEKSGAGTSIDKSSEFHFGVVGEHVVKENNSASAKFESHGVKRRNVQAHGPRLAACPRKPCYKFVERRNL